MSRKSLFLLAAVALVGFSATAEPACPSDVELAQLLAAGASAPELPGMTPAPLDLFATGTSATRCYISVSCGSYSINCSVAGSSCSGADRNCAIGQRGFVTCNGATTWCPICACTDGEYRWLEGGCCSGQLKHKEQVCEGGVWKNTGYFECNGSCF